MKRRPLFGLFLLLMILPVSLGCEDELDSLRLRSEENEAYFTENSKEAARRFASIMRNKEEGYERFKIVHISDCHLSSWSSSNNYLLPINLTQSIRFANRPELEINSIVCTGDFISNGEKSDVKDYLRSFVANFYLDNHVPSFICTGNHDSNCIDYIQGSFLHKNELNQLLLTAYRNVSDHPAGENYYYSDIPNPQGGTIRFIALDMLDQPGDAYNTMYYASFSQAQVDWFSQVALKEGMTPEHSVIILSHYPFQRHDAGARTYLCDGDYINSWNMIPEIVEAFRTHSSLSKAYPNQLDACQSIQVDVDYSASSGEFVCYLGGHAHCNAYFNVLGLENASKDLPPQRMILCTNQAPSEIGTVYNRVQRKEDSASSNAFCLYAVDTREKRIYVTYFGAYKPVGATDQPESYSISYY